MIYSDSSGEWHETKTSRTENVRPDSLLFRHSPKSGSANILYYVEEACRNGSP
jgi:hypothetical protein